MIFTLVVMTNELGNNLQMGGVSEIILQTVIPLCELIEKLFIRAAALN